MRVQSPWGVGAGREAAVIRSRSRGAECVRGLLSLPSRKAEGAGSTGCTTHSRLACSKGTPRVHRSSPALPAQWFTAYTWSPRCAMRFSHRRERMAHSLDSGIGESGQHDFARPRLHRSSGDTRASIAPRAPRLVTNGRTPLLSRRDGEDNHKFLKSGRQLFLRAGLDRPNQLEIAREISF